MAKKKETAKSAIADSMEDAADISSIYPGDDFNSAEDEITEGEEAVDRGDDGVPSLEEQVVAEQEGKGEEEEKGEEKDSADDVEEVAEEDTADPEEGILDAEGEEVDDEEGGEEEPTAKDSDQRIPKQRFDKINERRKAAEQENADLKARVEALEAKASETLEEPVPEFDFDGKEESYMEAVIDGDTELAKSIRKEIRTAEREVYKRDTPAVDPITTTQQVKSKMEFDAKVLELSDKYDAFNINHDDFDQTLTDEAVAMQKSFVSQGQAPADALSRAAEYVAKFYELESNTKATDAPPAKPPAKKTDVKAKAKAAAKQPPKMNSSIGESDDGVGVPESMTDEEFDALPETTKRRMRGDMLT